MKTTFTRFPKASAYLLLFAFFFAGINIVIAQNKIEIVIVGSAHGNGGTDEFYRDIIDKLKSYNPDMVFGEYMSPEDMKEALAAGHMSLKRVNRAVAYLKVRDPKGADKKVNMQKAYSSLNKFAFYHKTRMDLARNLYLNHDCGNAEYQFYVLSQHMQDKFENREKSYFEKAFGTIDSLQKVGLIRKQSEYQRIYFPLMYELGHERIYAADCQKYEAAWNQASVKAATAIKAMQAAAKADSTSPEGLAVRAMNNYNKEANKRMQGVDWRTYEFMNSELYAELDEVVNLYGGKRYFNEPGFPKEEVQDMINWWTKRDEGICENIIRQAREKGATRVIVGVGSSHRKGMEEIFAKMPDVKLVNYNDLP